MKAPAPADSRVALPPFWLPILAGLPVTLCMAVMALPDLGHGHAGAYRALYAVAYVIWTIPLTALQRGLWRRHMPWWLAILVLLSLTYLLSLVNSVIAQRMAVAWGQLPSFLWSRIFSGLDGCWLALIAFCAIHAVIAYYFELKHEQQRVLMATSLARDAELRALRYQLHPHFLFNTLNAISSLVVEGRSRDATRMIARLGDFLRATLEGGDNHEVALADELSLTEHYLDIEKARLGSRLSIGMQIGPDSLHALVPYLLLQPLVENAIRHGIAQRREPGRIDLHISRMQDRLQLRIRNDGASTNSGQSQREHRPSAIGLRNVRERLEKLYPSDYHMAYGPTDDGGYAVSIELPFRPGLAASTTVQALAP
ncbi:sensor histidine kinase [Dyella silvatica]|uniref:sensor histidine kinase n=1 Tax=Dyella silvatica TaxID=2992128 RepID=UPI002256BCC9|nr:sensor histidine kinase [Dyella silvatica]